jgi:hypothetical protein
VSDSINSYMTRINPLVPLLFKRREARFGSLTGSQGGGGNHQIKTPYGTLGVRG